MLKCYGLRALGINKGLPIVGGNAEFLGDFGSLLYAEGAIELRYASRASLTTRIINLSKYLTCIRCFHSLLQQRRVFRQILHRRLLQIRRRLEIGLGGVLAEWCAADDGGSKVSGSVGYQHGE
jgi:hypothetical protein